MPGILVVEDDENLNRGITFSLKKSGYEVFSAESVKKAKRIASDNNVDVTICDVNLPDGNGLEFVRWMRCNYNTYIICLTALDQEMDQVMGYEAGADDYITKPFEPEEVIARIQAALRRTATSKKLSCLNLELYPDSRKVTVHGIELSLTAHEYDLLYLFIKNPEKVYSREMLYDLVWHGGYYGENNTVNVHVSNLRKKIKEADPENEYIRTVYGIGFKLVLHSNKTKFEAVI